MKPINQAWCIQIEVNNICPGRCLYCTRFNSHMPADKRYSMSPQEVSRILDSLEVQGYTGKVGLIGGEPTIHPEFREVCSVVWEKWTSKDRWLALWTSGGQQYEKNKPLIDSTFSWVAYNDHRDPECHHQRMTMASQDVVPEIALRVELIDKCWVQRIWCPAINLKGAFFCECAAAWDLLLDGPGGWSLDEPWLRYGHENYDAQMWCCNLCGMPVPMPADSPFGDKEWMSETVLSAMRKAEAVRLPDLSDYDYVDRAIYDERVKDWEPGEYTPGRAKGGAE